MGKHLRHLALITLFIVIFHESAISTNIDKVVAYINNTAITKRELDEQHSKNLLIFPEISRRQTLEAMINTKLMLIDARKMRLSAADDTKLLQKYLDLKVRSLVLVTDNDVTEYFRENREKFGNSSLQDVKETIRVYLEEALYNKLIKDHINSLMQRSVIKIIEQ